MSAVQMLASTARRHQRKWPVIGACFWPDSRCDGSAVTMPGNNQISATASTIQAKNGKMTRASQPISGPAMPCSTNRLTPTGGVICANATTSTRKMPNHTRSLPACCTARNATTVVEPGWAATTTARGDLLLQRVRPRAQCHAAGTQADPVTPELFHNLFTGTQPQFDVASRGHHADIDGSTPGSVPPFLRSIGEEGVLIDNLLPVRDGQLLEAELRALLASGPWPARNPDQTLADLRAQIAANAKGVQALRAMGLQWGRPTVAACMQPVQDNAEESVRRVTAALKPLR